MGPEPADNHEVNKKEAPNTKELMKISKIIPKAYQTELLLIPYVIVTAQAKNASKIIQILKQYDRQENQIDNKERQNQQNPFKMERKEKQKPFLKRVYKTSHDDIRIIISPKQDQRHAQMTNRLQEQKLISSVLEVELPQHPPVTKQQYAQWSQIWPINFIQQEVSKETTHTQSQQQFYCHLMTNTEHPADFYLVEPGSLKVLFKESGPCPDGTIDHPIMRLLQQWPGSEIFRQHPDKYYYLTGLRLVSRRQVCGMCSMALVHSRLSGIYLQSAPTEVMDSIMGCPALNHHIHMFRIQ